MFFPSKRARVSFVNGDISEALFNSVPSKSKKIRFIKILCLGYGLKHRLILKFNLSKGEEIHSSVGLVEPEELEEKLRRLAIGYRTLRDIAFPTLIRQF
jgi:hypothetical protein